MALDFRKNGPSPAEASDQKTHRTPASLVEASDRNQARRDCSKDKEADFAQPNLVALKKGQSPLGRQSDGRLSRERRLHSRDKEPAVKGRGQQGKDNTPLQSRVADDEEPRTLPPHHRAHKLVPKSDNGGPLRVDSGKKRGSLVNDRNYQWYREDFEKRGEEGQGGFCLRESFELDSEESDKERWENPPLKFILQSFVRNKGTAKKVFKIV